MISWSRCHAIESPCPASNVIRRIRMIDPAKFAFTNFVKLLGGKSFILLVRTRHRWWVETWDWLLDWRNKKFSDKWPRWWAWVGDLLRRDSVRRTEETQQVVVSERLTGAKHACRQPQLEEISSVRHFWLLELLLRKTAPQI